MGIFPDTPKTLLDELARGRADDDARWSRFDAIYRPVVANFLSQRFMLAGGELEEIVQLAMTRLATVVLQGRYEAARAKFRTFASHVVSHVAIDELRRRARGEGGVLPFDAAAELESASAAEIVERQWDESCYRAAVEHVLRQLPWPEKYVEAYRALETGEKAVDVAARLGVKASFVRQVRHRVNTKVAAYIKYIDGAR